MSKDFETVRFCLTCGQRAPDGCRDGHDVLMVKLLDIAGMWREHDEQVQRQREFEARKLGEVA